jgi:putative hydrolase
MPGNPFGVPFNMDLNEIMRMLQSPGPVNMELARTTADAVATSDAESGEPKPEPPIAPEHVKAFEDVVRAVQLTVSTTTGLSAALAVPTSCVNRSEWSSATLAGLEPVLVALAGALGRGMGPGGFDPQALEQLGQQAMSQNPMGMTPEAMFGMVMQQLLPALLGTWAGSMIGLLSHKALGQYDLPLPLAGDAKLLFVVRNVDAFADEWSLPIDELRYALALREVVHGAQRSVPWVRDRLVRLASEYVSAYEVQATAIEDQLGNIDPNDPSSADALQRLSDPDMLLGAMQSERQTPMLEELQRFVSVLEGYTDVVVEALGERMVPAHGRIDEALRRHRLERGEAKSFVDRLLGLELDRGHYDAGVAFCRGVMERSDGGFEQLNRLWTSEAMVPTAAELRAPGLWLARIDLPED